LDPQSVRGWSIWRSFLSFAIKELTMNRNSRFPDFRIKSPRLLLTRLSEQWFQPLRNGYSWIDSSGFTPDSLSIAVVLDQTRIGLTFNAANYAPHPSEMSNSFPSRSRTEIALKSSRNSAKGGQIRAD
jgi:hypothetical protein